MLPTTPAGHRGAPSTSGRIGAAGTPICCSALRAQYRAVPYSRRRSVTASATAAASIENIVDSGTSRNISAHAAPGTSVSIIARPPGDGRAFSNRGGTDDFHTEIVGAATETL